MTIWPFNLMDEPEVTGFDREERRFWARTEGCFRVMNSIVAVVALILLYTVPNQTAAQTMSTINRDIQQLNHSLKVTT
ncbi:hypothetical protein GGP41_001940 [Bipolaris sorokiniana]|uniref:Uncharacterized protein n=2 Tax=Cochliobolus sativus TaxID=45130 RepID=A0A8H5ZT54_COCSA|nr:uncharacterized protein COCSADRAFT_162128 [Bipolaris sorokiniana ND90Pr]EMD62550.1 hypothetical protein COCSADRAFT_162128 [Bipolaris sorokiniana ND90Pr]KAF5853393.1 hypothetical protein GGP41_001940 [Bipolaris sorokiniana]